MRAALGRLGCAIGGDVDWNYAGLETVLNMGLPSARVDRARTNADDHVATL